MLSNGCVGCLLLTNTVLTIPIYSALFSSFYCTPMSKAKFSQNADSCYDTVHIVGIVLSVFSFAMFVSIKVGCLTLMYERNPFKENIFGT